MSEFKILLLFIAPDVYGTPPVSGVPVGADWASRPQTFPKMAREQWIMTAEQKRAFGMFRIPPAHDLQS